MKTLGIEKEYPGPEDSGVSIKVGLSFFLNIKNSIFKVPLSKYTERDILEAFRRKLESSAASKSSAQVVLHESYQVVKYLIFTLTNYILKTDCQTSHERKKHVS